MTSTQSKYLPSVVSLTGAAAIGVYNGFTCASLGSLCCISGLISMSDESIRQAGE